MAEAFGKQISNLLKGKTGPQMRAGGWLWRQWAQALPPSDRPQMFFAVPLVSRRRAGDWGMVEANLARTLASFRAQSRGDWQAVVCGQDRPDAGLFDDRVSFLPFDGSDKFYDKGDKRVALLRHISRTVAADGYYMQFDADDILHPRFVEHVLSDDNGRGYLIDTGYMADLAAGLFARLAPKSPDAASNIPFNRYCGSSNAIRVDFRAGARGSAKLLTKLRAHGRIPAQMAAHGLAMDPVPFAAAIYLVNHGENMVERRGNLGGKLDYMQRHLVPEAEVAAIRRDFGLDSLPGV
ncbi:glycosyltransferase family 2 protein [Tropicimonas sp. IMCC34043]|uniref:glycosyltransferase family 2 protein n=1 Tax=Tropicimonas sp. IMCC34043 TaxID=2248760 RepID=UPI000E259E8E|nr:glycosyltransferase family 2 protein [Tropicimonas sp. IMCC34043]